MYTIRYKSSLLRCSTWCATSLIYTDLRIVLPLKKDICILFIHSVKWKYILNRLTLLCCYRGRGIVDCMYMYVCNVWYICGDMVIGKEVNNNYLFWSTCDRIVWMAYYTLYSNWLLVTISLIITIPLNTMERLTKLSKLCIQLCIHAWIYIYKYVCITYTTMSFIVYCIFRTSQSLIMKFVLIQMMKIQKHRRVGPLMNSNLLCLP